MPRWPVIATACTLLAFGLWAGDRVGWEGDDLAAMFGISYLDTVGRDNVYRYAWQPLTYELLHALGSTGLRFLNLTYAPNVAGMLGVALLMALLLRSLGPQTPRASLVALVLALAAPELWITSLYFNSTALALPVFVGSLLLVQQAQDHDHNKALLWSGGLFGLCCLLRMDFAAAGVFMLIMARNARPSTGWCAPAVWLTGAAVAPLTMLAVQPELINSMLGILGGYEAGQQAWGAAQSVKVMVLAVGPGIVVLPLLLYGTASAQPGGDSARWRVAGWLSLLPMLAPMKNLYSGKYLVPLLCCVLWLVARRIGHRFASPVPNPTWPIRTSLCATMLALSFVLSPVPNLAPAEQGASNSLMARWLRQPRPAFTHDGTRSVGGYLQLASWFRSPDNRPRYMRAYLDLIQTVEGCRDAVVVRFPADPEHYMNDPWTWGWVPLHLASRGWRMERFEPAEEIDLIAPDNRRRIRLLSTQRYRAASEPAALLDLGLATEEQGEDQPSAVVRYLSEAPQRHFCSKSTS